MGKESSSLGEDVKKIGFSEEKIVFSSDTHGIHKTLEYPPEGDIFIHAGDFTNKQDWKEVEKDKMTEYSPSLTSLQFK